MAAGLGSRFGGGLKQLAKVDDREHIIMDYSIHDAIAAGFRKIVFVIRRDIEADFRQAIGDRIEQICREKGVEVHYVFQSLSDIPEPFSVPEGRKKPWGTGHAVLAAKNVIRESFAIINADDYYGREAFIKIHDFLSAEPVQGHFCMAAFQLRNTLSEFGAVTRGICRMDGKGFLTDVVETLGIQPKWDPESEEMVVMAGEKVLDPDAPVSMNMWGFTPDFMQMLEEGFREFLANQVPGNPEKAEFLVPIYIGKLLKEGSISVLTLRTGDPWFGVTYQEDKPRVMKNFRKLIDRGVYREDLYSDL